MLPGKLEDGNFMATIRRWRDLWNNQLRDHLQSMHLVAGKGIRIQRYPGGTVVSAERNEASGVSSAATADEYYGYFKIEDVSTETEHRIMVVDGNSYDPAEGTSGPSRCLINSRVREIEPWDSGPISASSGQYQFVVLQYHHDGTEEHVSVRLMKNLLDGGNETHPTLQYYLIGTIAFHDDEMTVTQSHWSGAIAMNGCGPSTLDFGISAFYREPAYDGGHGIPEKIRVNGGMVKVSWQEVMLDPQEYEPFDDGAEFRIFLSVHAAVAADFSSVSYTAEFYTGRPGDFPPCGALHWYTDIGRVDTVVHQANTGIITVTGVWV